MNDKAHRATDKRLARIERQLREIYSRSDREIREKWEAYINRIAEKAEKLRAKIDTAEDKEAAEKAYKDFLRKSLYQDERYKQMVEQTAERLSHVNETAVAYVNGQLPPVYALNYNQVAGQMNGFAGISYTMVDENTVKNLATSKKTLLPYKKVNGKKDIRWNTKRINAEVLQGILQGESVAQISKRLANVEAMNKESAIRNARTMVTSAENKGRMDMLDKAEADGIVTQKVWRSAHDGRTRNAHLLLDGQAKDPDKPFVVTVVEGKKHPRVVTYEIRYPGDPKADPAMVYNCRCTLTYKVVGFRKANGEIERIT